MTWEHYEDLPFEVICTDKEGKKHLISRHKLGSEASHAAERQNRSGGYAAEYYDWRQKKLEGGSSTMPTPREVKCPLCNDFGQENDCPGCGKSSSAEVNQLRAHAALQTAQAVQLEVSGEEFIYIVMLCREQVRRLRGMGIEPRESLAMLERFRAIRPDCLLAQDPAIKSILETFTP